MAGFVLKNTLSDNGAVTRGICQMDEQNYLQTVHETAGIVKTQAEQWREKGIGQSNLWFR